MGHRGLVPSVKMDFIWDPLWVQNGPKLLNQTWKKLHNFTCFHLKWQTSTDMRYFFLLKLQNVDKIYFFKPLFKLNDCYPKKAI